MYFIKILSSCCILFMSINRLHAQSKSTADKMEWFQDAKFGIFIHWGIYAVNGISESWSFYNNYINHENYMAQLNGFSASDYYPDEWVDLIEASGAKYSVITGKHHDGVALWPSKAPGAITVSKDAKAKRDLLSPFVKALKDRGIKVGIYYSLPDWSHADYDVFTRYRTRYHLKDDPARWERFNAYQQQQLRELGKRYSPDLFWFDGDWEHSDVEWKAASIASLLREYNPQTIINARLGHHGDYETPEQGVPIVKPKAPYWELCYTMNDSWGYQPLDMKYKSGNMLIRTLVDCIAMGGNLLLDIGPRADGSIPPEQVVRLQEIGRWAKKHREAIYGTRAGFENLSYTGKNALSGDGKVLYLYMERNNMDDVIVRNLATQVKSAYVVAEENKAIAFVQTGNRLHLKLPKSYEDQDVTVMALHFDEPIQLSDAQEGDAESVEAGFPEFGQANAKLQIEELVYRLDKGGNLLANTGLTIDGLGFTPDRLAAISKDESFYAWTKKHAEAFYETGKSLPMEHYNGYSTLSADGQTIYLFVEGAPTGPIALKGLKNAIQRVRIVGEGSIIGYSIYNKLYWSGVPGLVYIDIPPERQDKNMTVISILLDGPVDLYRESIGVIDDNK